MMNSLRRLDDEHDCDSKDKKEKGEADKMLGEMLATRTIIIAEEVSPELSRRVLGQLVLLNRRSESEPIRVYINSPGGCADSGFAIYDMLRFFPAPVITIVSGLCASAGIVIFLAAEKGKRLSLANSRFMLHQPSTGVRGTASDIEITADEIIKTRVRYNSLVGECTGKTMEQVTKDCDRDFWMSPEECVAYNLVDRIVVRSADIG